MLFKSYSFILCLLSISICPWRSNKAYGSDSLQPLNSSGGTWFYQPSYSDEFNALSLDSRKWDNAVPSWGKTWSWLPSNAYLSNGNLVLKAKHEKHIRHHNILFQNKSQEGEYIPIELFYTSGIVKSKAPSIKYGYFEARIKSVPLFPGLVPAFWLYKINGTKWTEIDIVELNQKDNPHSIDMNLHVFKHPNISDGVRKKPGKHFYEYYSWTAPWDPRDEYHVYGCEWNKYTISWYIDGKLVHIQSNTYWDQGLDITLSLGIRKPFKGSNLPIPGTLSKALVDYIRVWKRY